MGLVDDADTASAYELFYLVDEEAVGGYKDSCGFEDRAELAGLFEVEQELAFAGRVDQDGVEFFEQRRVGIVERDLNAKGFGEFELYVFEGLDAVDGELGGGVFFAAQDAADYYGDVDL
jgi:hypothetical protein